MNKVLVLNFVGDDGEVHSVSEAGLRLVIIKRQMEALELHFNYIGKFRYWLLRQIAGRNLVSLMKYIIEYGKGEN